MKKLIETIRNIWNIVDLRERLLVTLGILAIYRFGSFVVIPGVDPAQLSALQDQTADGLLGLLNMFTGGAFSQASIFANQCFNKGNTKITLGTGASILTNIGKHYTSKKNIITTFTIYFFLRKQ